jgi:hypothetical protein
MRYTQLDSALRLMGGELYDALSFRHAVVGRDAASAPAGQLSSALLLEAARTDSESTLSFLRCIDCDCDGVVTEADLCHAVLSRTILTDDVETTDERWHTAALAMEASAPRRAIREFE